MKRKPYWEMNSKELAEATRQFDEPFVIDRSRPLTAAEREEWNRLKRKPGRPKVGRGFQRVSITMERGLLQRVTALAKKRRLSRSKLLGLVLEQALAREEHAVD